RNLGKTQPKRYLPAVQIALRQYEDADAADGLALLDNWGLIHILFHDSPVLWARQHGWTLAENHSLGELRPAPAYPQLWSPAALLQLLKEARCRPVLQWVLYYLRDDPSILGKAPLEDLLALVAHDDAEIAVLAAECLQKHPGLAQISMERWLAL